MLLRPKFSTITGPDWARSLNKARRHRKEAREKLRQQIAAKKNTPTPSKLVISKHG